MRTALQESFWERLGGVVTLQRPTYEALQHDPEATGQSWLIVTLLGLANGIAVITTPIATVLPGMPDDLQGQVQADAAEVAAALSFDTTERRLLALAAGVIGAIISWYLSAWLLRVIGNRMASNAGRAVSPEEMRRLVAWGYAPSLASFLAPIPLIGGLLATLGTLWAFVTGVMAVRAAFNVGIGRAIAIEIVAFLLVLLVVIAVVTITLIIALAAV
jgi:hypothetical protein